MEATLRIVTGLEKLKDPFLQFPETALSLADASRLTGLDADVCDLLLGALVDRRFLTLNEDGSYRRKCAVQDDAFTLA